MPLQRACDAVNQGGTADKNFYSSLTESIFLSGTFFMQWKHSLVPVAVKRPAKREKSLCQKS